MDERLIQDAGKSAWLFLLKWSLNFAYSGRKARKPGETKAAAAQEAAEAQLMRYVLDFVEGPPHFEHRLGAPSSKRSR